LLVSLYDRAVNLRLRKVRRARKLSRQKPGAAGREMPYSPAQQDRQSWVRTVIIGRNPKLTFIRIIVLVVVSLIVFKYVFLPVRVDGPSMQPTYREGGVNFVNRLAYLKREPQRGDVVAVRYTGNSIMLMKRVVGLPGETIEFVNGRLVVNGQFLDEPYVKLGCDWNIRPEHYRLRDDEYYVVGDNRSMPFENHQQGAARRGKILGRVML
jgi:signal peptidase I